MFKKALTTMAIIAISSTPAFAATAPDFSQMTSGVDFSTAQAAVIAIGVAIAGLYIAIAGARGVLRMIR